MTHSALQIVLAALAGAKAGPSAPSATVQPVAELERLWQMRQSGALTDADYQTLKPSLVADAARIKTQLEAGGISVRLS